MPPIEGCVERMLPYYSEAWKLGPPRGIMFHHTGIMKSPEEIFQDLLDRGSSAHFLVNAWPSEQPSFQMVELSNRSWHANIASDYYFSILHIANPGEDELSVEQLRESSRIAAEIIRYSKTKWGVNLPVVRSPGREWTPGFKEHRDGAGEKWNELLFVDGLTKTWDRYLKEVKNNLEDDDMALFEDKEDFRREILKAIVGNNKDGEANMDSDRILASFEFINGLQSRMMGEKRPEKVSAYQKGWDFSEKIYEIEDFKEKTDMRSGKLTGTVVFE